MFDLDDFNDEELETSNIEPHNDNDIDDLSDFDMNSLHADSGLEHHDHPEYTQDINGGVIVTDIIGGQHHYSSMEEAQMMSDAFSGFPIHINSKQFTSEPSSNDVAPASQDPNLPSMDELRLQKNDELTELRDDAVNKYHEALDRGDTDTAAHWHDVAFDAQRSLDTLWNDIGKFGLETYVPGIGSEP